MNTIASTLRKDAGGVHVLTSQAQAIIPIPTMRKKMMTGKPRSTTPRMWKKMMTGLPQRIEGQYQCERAVSKP